MTPTSTATTQSLFAKIINKIRQGNAKKKRMALAQSKSYKLVPADASTGNSPKVYAPSGEELPGVIQHEIWPCSDGTHNLVLILKMRE